MYPTSTHAHFIHLRACGSSYRAIERDTGISRNTLMRWGKKYEIEIARLKYQLLFRIPPPCDGPSPEGLEACAQESYFYNLDGYPEVGRDATPLASVPRRRRSTLQRKFRKFLRSPLVRSAIRYALFKR